MLSDPPDDETLMITLPQNSAALHQHPVQSALYKVAWVCVELALAAGFLWLMAGLPGLRS